MFISTIFIGATDEPRWTHAVITTTFCVFVSCRMFAHITVVFPGALIDRLDSTISTSMIRISTVSEYLMDIQLEISNALYTRATHFVVYGWLTSGNVHL